MSDLILSNLDVLVLGSLTFVCGLFLVGTILVLWQSDRKRLISEAEAMAEITKMFDDTQRVLDERAKQGDN